MNAMIADLRVDKEARKAFFNTLEKEMEDHALMCCAIQVLILWFLEKILLILLFFPFFQNSSPFEEEERTDLGLVKGHAYGITAVKKIDLHENKFLKMFK